MNAMIKIKSKNILVGKNIRASSMLIFGIAVAVIFGLLPELFDSLSRGTPYEQWTRLAFCAVTLISSLTVLLPLRIGSEAWFYSGARGKEPSAVRVLYWWKPSKAMKSTAVALSVFFRKLMWSAIFLLPGLFMAAGAVYTVMNEGMSGRFFAAFVSGTSMLIVVGAVFLSVMLQKYFLVNAIVAENPYISVKDAVKCSAETMDGRYLKTFLFKLSFTPWLLLCIAILPMFVIWPYYRQSCSCLKFEILRNAEIST